MAKKNNKKNRKGGDPLITLQPTPTPQESASNWFSNAYSSIKKSASDLAQNASTAAQSVSDKGAAMISNQPTYTPQMPYTQPGGKTRRRKGGYSASRSLSNIAASAAPINGINTAKAQVWVGGKTRKHFCTKRHKHLKSCKVRKYGKGTLSKTHKGDMDFTTKKGNKVYHRKGHYVKKSTTPFSKTIKKMFNIK